MKDRQVRKEELPTKSLPIYIPFPSGINTLKFLNGVPKVEAVFYIFYPGDPQL